MIVMVGSSHQAGLITVLACVTAYSLCWMAQAPLLPYLVNSLGIKDTLSYGRLQTFFSFAQLIGGLLSGPLIDRYGPRTLLLLSLWASAVSYALTASATNLAGLYISRLPTVLQHAILAARSIVAANVGPAERAKVLGWTSSAYGLGFAIGPALGGTLSRVNLRLTAWAATVGSLLSVAAVMAFVPSGHKQVHTNEPNMKDVNKTTTRPQGSSWLQSIKVLKYPAVRQLLAVKLISGLASALLQSVFSLMLQKEYGLNSQQNGMVLSYVGVLTMAAQGLVVGPARQRLGDNGAVRMSCLLLLASYMLLAASRSSLPKLMVAMLPTCIGGAILTTINTAQLTQAAPEQVMGSVLALDMSLFSGVRLFTPTASTWLLEYGGGVKGIGLAAAGLMAALLAAMQTGLLRSDAINNSSYGVNRQEAKEDANGKTG